MRLTILGCHSPFPGQNQANPSYLLEIDGLRILLDCGTGATANLQAHMNVWDLDLLVLTHLHPDHSADLIPLGFALMRAHMEGNLQQPVRVLMPPEGTSLFTDVANKMGNLSVHFKNSFAFEDYGAERLSASGLALKFFPTAHSMNCHGVRIEGSEGTIVYTGDTAFDASLIQKIIGADVLLTEAGGLSKEHAQNTKHMTPPEAAELGHASAVKHLVLTHFLPGTDTEAIRTQAKTSYSGTLHIASEGKSINF